MSHGKSIFPLFTLAHYPVEQDPYDDQHYDDLDAEEFEEITQEDCWTVISSFFEQKGLVRQQLDSFDEFVQNTMQELVDENADLILDQADQHTGQEGDVTRRYEIQFGQIYLSRPTVTEADGSVVPVFPQEARLRNLTYSAPLYIEMKKKVLVGREEADGEMSWESAGVDSSEDSTKVWIGKVTMLVYCLQHESCLSRFQSCFDRPSAFFAGSLNRISMI